jgi:hypothetical protein
LFYSDAVLRIKSNQLNDDIVFDSKEKISQKALGNSNAKIFQKKRVLITFHGATLSKPAVCSGAIDVYASRAICCFYDNNKSN